jgi:hypothetical protein
LAINHLVLVVYFHSDIEVDNFKTKVPVDNKAFGLDVPVGDTELVKIRDALDKAPADLSDLPIKLATTSGIIFGRMAHDVDCVWNDSCNEIMCSDFSWKVFRSLKILSSFDSS